MSNAFQLSVNVFVAAVLVTSPFSIRGQTKVPFQESDKGLKGGDLKKHFDAKVVVVKKAILVASGKKISEKILDLDAKVVFAAGKKIQEEFQKSGLTEIEVVDASLHSWLTLRIGRYAIPHSQELEAGVLIATTGTLGAVRLKTEPPGAHVEVGGKKHKEKTPTTVFEEDGKKIRIKLIMDGYEVEEFDVEIKGRRVVTIEKKLKKISDCDRNTCAPYSMRRSGIESNLATLPADLCSPDLIPEECQPRNPSHFLIRHIYNAADQCRL